VDVVKGNGIGRLGIMIENYNSYKMSVSSKNSESVYWRKEIKEPFLLLFPSFLFFSGTTATEEAVGRVRESRMWEM
jgi:hypothetical protein